MFKIFASRKAKAVITHTTQQHTLDSLRYQYATDPSMQLHLDRMQTSLDLLRSV